MDKPKRNYKQPSDKEKAAGEARKKNEIAREKRKLEQEQKEVWD